MFNKKSFLFIVVLLTLSILFVACGEDDEALINQSLDTFIEGIEAGNVEKIGSVLAEEVYDSFYDESITGVELAEEFGEIKTIFAYDEVDFMTGLDDITLQDLTDDTVTVDAIMYMVAITPKELIIEQLGYMQSFYEIEEIGEAIEALEDEDYDSAKDYLLASNLFSDEEIEEFISGEQEEREEIELGLIKEDGEWYINSIN